MVSSITEPQRVAAELGTDPRISWRISSKEYNSDHSWPYVIRLEIILHVRSTSGFAVHEPPVMASDVCSLMRVYFINDIRSVSKYLTPCVLNGMELPCVPEHAVFLSKDHPFNEVDRKGSRSMRMISYSTLLHRELVGLLRYRHDRKSLTKRCPTGWQTMQGQKYIIAIGLEWSIAIVMRCVWKRINPGDERAYIRALGRSRGPSLFHFGDTRFAQLPSHG